MATMSERNWSCKLQNQKHRSNWGETVSRSFIFLEVFDSATMAAYYFLKKVAWIIHLLTCRKLPVKVQATEVHYFVVGQRANHLSKHCCSWIASTNRHKCLFELNFKAVAKNVFNWPWVVARGIQRVDTCKRIQHMRLEGQIIMYIWYIYVSNLTQ
jgi:hypothetical protein